MKSSRSAVLLWMLRLIRLALVAVALPALAHTTSSTGVFAWWGDWNGQSWSVLGEMVPFDATAGAPFTIGDGATAPNLVDAASDGTAVLVVWGEANGNGARIRGRFLGGTTFTISDDVDVTFAGTSHLPQMTPPIVSWNGTRYAVFWRGRTASQVAFVSSAAIVEPARALPAIGPVRAAAGASTTLVLWIDNDGATMTLRGAEVSPDGSVSPAVAIATMPVSIGFGATYLDTPHLAWNGTAFYAAWTAGRTGRYQLIEGTRLTATGVPIDNGPLSPSDAHAELGRTAGRRIADVGTDSVFALEASPAGARFLVSWLGPSALSSQSVVAALVDDGTVLDPTVLRSGISSLEYRGLAASRTSLAILRVVDDHPMLDLLGASRRRELRH